MQIKRLARQFFMFNAGLMLGVIVILSLGSVAAQVGGFGAGGATISAANGAAYVKDKKVVTNANYSFDDTLNILKVKGSRLNQTKLVLDGETSGLTEPANGAGVYINGGSMGLVPIGVWSVPLHGVIFGADAYFTGSISSAGSDGSRGTTYYANASQPAAPAAVDLDGDGTAETKTLRVSAVMVDTNADGTTDTAKFFSRTTGGSAAGLQPFPPSGASAGVDVAASTSGTTRCTALGTTCTRAYREVAGALMLTNCSSTTGDGVALCVAP